MKYYRVKPEFDNKPQTKRKNHYRLHVGIWIANELYTACELNHMEKRGIIIPDEIFEHVEINRNNTYWFFGARFSNDTGVTVPF
jgi:hypothetical protein